VLMIMMLKGILIKWTIIYYIWVIVALLLFNLGLSFSLSVISVFFADVSYLWKVFVRIMFFSTPIFYKLSYFGDYWLNDLLRINPLSQILILSRECLLYGTVPSAFNLMLLMACSLVVFVMGLLIFRSLERFVADKL